MNFTVTCLCGCPGTLMSVEGGNLTLWRQAVALRQVEKITCPTCKCEHDLVDNTSSIGSANVATPRIDSINVTSGSNVGGTAVILTGHKLNSAGLVVKFGGVAATGLRNQSDTHATIDTPAIAFEEDEVSRAVDVVVSNSRGTKPTNSKLALGFTYHD